MTFSLVLLYYVSANLALTSSVHLADLPSVIPAQRICKSGPPLRRTPGKINCLVIGDSISIGYVLNLKRISDTTGNLGTECYRPRIIARVNDRFCNPFLFIVIVYGRMFFFSLFGPRRKRKQTKPKHQEKGIRSPEHLPFGPKTFCRYFH